MTLVEILVVVAIIVLGIGGTINPLWKFYQNNELLSEQRNIIAYLTLARSRAMANKNQMSQGLFIDNTNATIFEGRNFINRNTLEDLIFSRSKIVTAGETLEIVFSQLSGTTTAATTTLTVRETIQHIVINSEGLIQ